MRYKMAVKKKPLGGLTAEAAKPEGAVLGRILAGLRQLSNPTASKNVLFHPNAWQQSASLGIHQ